MVVVSERERDKRRGEEENGVLLVVWVSPEAATVVADGRATKEGEQMKALAMPLMELQPNRSDSRNSCASSAQFLCWMLVLDSDTAPRLSPFSGPCITFCWLK
ncbi:hypothetical protein MTR67_012554 [Solanum verrucosum]|uniref:Uncharacterized protein n=1 Tax=Solanum verrucosum TaxID=315347 RepID=A0AAF0Q8S0_SOLVR|nr:hypothetical protein MTR67_012554 [Solanum verrucosum]